ncbi:putative membrane protein YeaQ/YmgE (transglycosylase-associated protein family) [Allocatelliglobosispora scoriae]|uniref:Putative membrane protein YeaQ/YmgE (Transglycosylase-associated protein family) n=1 Tax=Allocatelliglobosispora scoriae TaxID=643052 RepID=A0A841BMZ3_9ACTN|nr:hypothetical protein [Allocatelliglobosispora scoriae]MBB5868190.1 putative membrane protein YeaQ/YmgE (transglycosylase-associated protein family) [Allocatelliglobosispora scoriae]
MNSIFMLLVGVVAVAYGVARLIRRKTRSGILMTVAGVTCAVIAALDVGNASPRVQRHASLAGLAALAAVTFALTVHWAITAYRSNRD